MKRFDLNRTWKNDLLKLNRDRRKLSRQEFLEEMVEKGYQEEIAGEVYHQVENCVPKMEGFSIRPEDDLVSEYQLDPEDVEDLVARVFRRTRRKLPSLEEQKVYFEGKGMLPTIEEKGLRSGIGWLVMFISEIGS